MKKIKLTFLKPFLFACLGLMIATIAVALEPAELPGEPSKPKVDNVWKDGCTLTFDAPQHDGGSAIIGYIVEKRSKYDREWRRENKEFIAGIFYNVYNLVEWREYEFRIRAVNSVGIGPASDVSDIYIHLPIK